MATQLLQVNAITKVVQYQGIQKTIPDSYWTSDIVPAIYPNWDSDKDKLVLFAWYDNNSYMCQRRKYAMNFKTNAFEWRDYEMDQVDDGSGLTLYNKFKDTFFLIDSLETEEYQKENILQKFREDIKIAKIFYNGYFICIIFKIIQKIFQIKIVNEKITSDYLSNLEKELN